MGTSGSVSRFTAALVAATALVMLTTGVALAHPESEGDHPSGCVVTAEPGTVPVGGQFTVSGNFGGASIFVLPGADASPAEDAVPAVTTPEGQDFSVTFTATGSPGDITVVALLPESECGDSDGITVTAHAAEHCHRCADRCGGGSRRSRAARHGSDVHPHEACTPPRLR